MRQKATNNLTAIPLNKAALCIDCEHVIVGGDKCPCGSRVLLWLEPILNANRELKEENKMLKKAPYLMLDRDFAKVN